METEKKAKIVKEDQISVLPEDILVRILSLLTVREAQATSVLSTRWRYLWTHSTSLDFTNIPFMTRSKFINWVNKVCSSIKSPSIEQFIIDYTLNENVEDTVDKLVDCAMEKGVKDLKLTLNASNSGYWKGCILSRRPVSSGFKHLRSLNLKYIDISGETVEHFLLHCSSLEQISIEKSSHLSTLKVGVGGPLCNLKFLKIFDCYDLIYLQICAPKLSNFQIKCPNRINLIIDNVPLLSHVYIGGPFGDCLTWAFCALSTQLSQIQTLELCLKSCRACDCEFGCCAWKNVRSSPLLNLPSLRELTAGVSGSDDQNLIRLLSFLKVSPSLEKLKVEISQMEFRRTTWSLEVTTLKPSPHQHLKVLEVANFVDHPNVVEFVKQISRAALRLEKVVIDPPPCRFLPPRPGRILFTKQFEELFEEVMSSRIYQRIEIVLEY